MGRFCSLGTFGDVWGCLWGWRVYWPLVGRSQGCHQMSYDAQDSATRKTDLTLIVHSAVVENPAPIPFSLLGTCVS